MKEKTSVVSLQEEAKEQAFQKAADLLAMIYKNVPLRIQMHVTNFVAYRI